VDGASRISGDNRAAFGHADDMFGGIGRNGAVRMGPGETVSLVLLDASGSYTLSRGFIHSPPPGCHFHPRCPFANERCRMETPQPITAGSSEVRCHAVEEGRLDEQAIRRELAAQS
jgi:hypothetical protein